MDEPRTEELAALATRAIDNQVHPANWSYWVRLVMMGGPARDFIEAASPTVVLDLIEQVRLASRPAVRDGLQEALIPLASRMADHLFHPEDHDPKDECWIDLYRTIVGMDGPLADKGSREAER